MLPYPAKVVMNSSIPGCVRVTYVGTRLHILQQIRWLFQNFEVSMFFQNIKGPVTPSTKDVLRKHILRANHQTVVRMTALKDYPSLQVLMDNDK